MQGPHCSDEGFFYYLLEVKPYLKDIVIASLRDFAGFEKRLKKSEKGC